MLKEKVEGLNRELGRKQGEYDSLMQRLKRDFACTSIKEARKLLEGFRKDLTRMEGDYGKALKEFEEKWGDAL
jgi:hypothetical protein